MLDGLNCIDFMTEGNKDCLGWEKRKYLFLIFHVALSKTQKEASKIDASNMSMSPKFKDSSNRNWINHNNYTVEDYSESKTPISG